MAEEWRPIPGWENYEASNLGRVRNTLSTRNQPLTVPKIKKPFIRDGRPYISLSRGDRRATKQVGHLILLAFAGPRPPDRECSHLDGDSTHNRPENLAWETHVENMARKLDHGTVARGSYHGIAKLVERDVQIIRRMLDLKIPGRLIAIVFEVSEPTISAIRTGQRWRHVS